MNNFCSTIPRWVTGGAVPWRRVWSCTITAFAGLFILAGCGPNKAFIDKTMSGQIFWPGDPELPVVEYLWSVQQIDHIKEQNSLIQALTGSGENVMTDLRQSRGLVRPHGVFVDGKGRLFVTDTAAARVTVIDIDSGESFSFWETGASDLKMPLGVVADAAGRIFVADGEQNRVFIFDPKGRYAGELAHALERPAGLALDEARDRLYVSDTAAHTVLVFSLEGRLLSTIGGRGSEPGRFNYPTHLFVDRDGVLYVCDALNFRIQIFGPDGAYRSSFGELGSLIGNLEKPKGVAVDTYGHIYVVDSIQDKVKVFDQRGQLLITFGEKGHNLGQFWLPTGIFVDRNNTIYLADTYHGRVAAFRFLGRKE